MYCDMSSLRQEVLPTSLDNDLNIEHAAYFIYSGMIIIICRLVTAIVTALTVVVSKRNWVQQRMSGVDCDFFATGAVHAIQVHFSGPQETGPKKCLRMTINAENHSPKVCCVRETWTKPATQKLPELTQLKGYRNVGSSSHGSNVVASTECSKVGSLTGKVHPMGHVVQDLWALAMLRGPTAQGQSSPW